MLDWFNVPYEIQFHRKFVFTADSAEKLQKLNTGKLNLEDLSAESARVVFRNVQHGSVSSAKEIGVGISQLTPVIVNALQSQSFSVEQPELHIHPRMQTVLGDLFVFEGLFAAVENDGEVTITTRNIEGQIQDRHFNRKKVKDESFILVETHSEHLILRLLKRLREGILKPEDLAIYYFENDKGKTISNRIRVDSDGEFTTPWPEGFFEERLEELF
ncbi:MAG: putative ATPase [Salibacteraceae bacterium]